jgi:hypothetical protein
MTCHGREERLRLMERRLRWRRSSAIEYSSSKTNEYAVDLGLKTVP